MKKEIVVKMIEMLKNKYNNFSFYQFEELLRETSELTENEKNDIFEAFANFTLRYFETNTVYGLDVEGNHYATGKKVTVKTSFNLRNDLYAQKSTKVANKEISEILEETDLIMYVCNYFVSTFFLEDEIKKVLRKGNIIIVDKQAFVDMIGWGNIRFWNSLSEYFKNM